MTFRTRFAPSPTGPLHLGHAYSALLAHDLARAANGDFLLRIEDIDQSRAKPVWEDQIYDDLTWLGISWPVPVLRQSANLPAYKDALTTLWQRGLLYPCTCNRRDILQAANAPQEGAALIGPDGIVYPGTCRNKPRSTATLLPRNAPLRFDLGAAAAYLPEFISFEERGNNVPAPEPATMTLSALQHRIGDFVVARRDMGTSYHLSVVVDDAAQAVTDVVRGADLFETTAIHVVLQKLLGLPTPRYHHHRLIRDDAGKRLAKRDDARAIATYRAEGATPRDIRRMVGLDV
ncbi:MAG: tRNA glutamyl-Q(34) synthetase GluQRS [Roseobacter sp.]